MHVPDRAGGTVATWYLASRTQILAALRSRPGQTADLQDLAREVYLRPLRVERPDAGGEL